MDLAGCGGTERLAVNARGEGRILGGFGWIFGGDAASGRRAGTRIGIGGKPDGLGVAASESSIAIGFGVGIGFEGTGVGIGVVGRGVGIGVGAKDVG